MRKRKGNLFVSRRVLLAKERFAAFWGEREERRSFFFFAFEGRERKEGIKENKREA